MQDNINTIISNALIVNKDILSKNIKPIITQIRDAIYLWQDHIFLIPRTF